MTPVVHTAISSVVSAIFWYCTKSWFATVTCFLSGIFIDLDHFIDFYVQKKRITLNYKEFFAYFSEEKAGRLFLLCHSYDLLILFWLLIFVLKLNMIWVGAAIGVTMHLIADLTNPMKPFAYFFIYRMKHGFKKEYIYPAYFYKTLK